ncbi:hypothetical protein CAEBREN_05409 [Caenorhabditis brenneri]|uniref:Uncharacterized protein n=1 Tax=Caenorhabditis brenneri TaxID=135651 RepID=G0PBK6_CAEBE|nr:hypothetical protein CAEBREN_05409 [Caenorhabditis brenneri]
MDSFRLSTTCTPSTSASTSSTVPGVSEEDDEILTCDCEIEKGEIRFFNPTTKKWFIRQLWRKEEMLEKEIAEIDELLINRKMDPEAVLWCRKELFTSPPKPVDPALHANSPNDAANLRREELQLINFKLAQENFALRLEKGLAVDAANREKARADMEKERADQAEQQIQEMEQIYKNNLDYKNEQHEIDLQAKEELYEKKLDGKQQKIAELERKIEELNAPRSVASSSRPSTSMDHNQTDSSTASTPSPSDPTVPGPSGSSAPEESWKRTVAPRHLAAYEETCRNMKLAPESFYQNDGPPKPQIVVEVPCPRVLYTRMMIEEGKENEWKRFSVPEKRTYMHLRNKLVAIQREQQKSGFIELPDAQEENNSRAQKRRRTSNPSYKGVEEAHAMKRCKTDH